MSHILEQGDWVDQDQTVANIETDKVTVQIKSPHAGKVIKFHVAEGDNLDVGKPLFDIDPEAQAPKKEGAQKEQPKKEPASTSSTKQQSKPSESKPPAPKLQTPKAPSSKPQQIKIEGGANLERKQIREPMSRLRQRVAQRLKESQNNYALLTTFQQVDMFQAMKCRKVIIVLALLGPSRRFRKEIWYQAWFYELLCQSRYFGSSRIPSRQLCD